MEIRLMTYAHPVSGTGVTLQRYQTGGNNPTEQLGANELIDTMALTLHTSLATISSGFFQDTSVSCARYEVIIRRLT